jgi:Flp pilus assembly protein TadD
MSYQGNAIGLAAVLLLCTQDYQLLCLPGEKSDPPALVVAADSDLSLDDARKAINGSDYGRARTLLKAYLRGHADSAEAHFLLAFSLLRLNDPKVSLAEYTRAAELRPPSPEELRYVAEDYALLDDYADAERWMQRSLHMNARDPDTWYGLGRIQYTLQKFPLAVESFEKALALAPHSVKVEDNLALAYEGMNREEDAIAAYQTALEWQKSADHPSEQPMLNLAIILTRKGKQDEAERLLQQAVTIAPKDPKIREQLGHLYMQQEHFDRAQLEFEQAVALAPDNASLHFLLGRVYRQEGMKEKADIEFARVAKLKGEKSTSGGP